MTEISLRDPVPLLVRSADVLRDDNDLLEELSLHIDPQDALALAAAPAPLARRALRRWLSDPYPPDLATLERIMAVARGEALACDIGENREIRRSKQRLLLQMLG
jgi:tRNA(Ile)-lysidine synthase